MTPQTRLRLTPCGVRGLASPTPAGRLCQDFGLILSVFSLFYLMVCFPVGLCYNALLVAVNLSNKVSLDDAGRLLTVNMAIAGLVLNLVAPVELLGPGSPGGVWEYNNEVYITLLILFNVSSLVIMYSTTLLSLDCTTTYIGGRHAHHHVGVTTPSTCAASSGGGAVLTSFQLAALLRVQPVSTNASSAPRCQNKGGRRRHRSVHRLRGPGGGGAVRRHAHPAHRKESRRRSRTRLPSGPVHPPSCCWRPCSCSSLDPYYLTLLVHTVAGTGGLQCQQRLAYFFLRCLSELLAFTPSSFAMPHAGR
ncbi:hypothetical protein DPEC_G00188550 [Dallia pectoralis]|uniref:Uncharacterized protein n=1 Tax=Dallia pectoralis TaxID=75939 RepID=A0ACC2GCE3_DALPE|nr:hypothetical protein DPEC_G00188550 [Dallia pectoralis]